jgi:hypothetical protein
MVTKTLQTVNYLHRVDFNWRKTIGFCCIWLNSRNSSSRTKILNHLNGIHSDENADVESIQITLSLSIK